MSQRNSNSLVCVLRLYFDGSAEVSESCTRQTGGEEGEKSEHNVNNYLNREGRTAGSSETITLFVTFF